VNAGEPSKPHRGIRLLIFLLVPTGDLPSQLKTNLQILNGLQEQLNNSERVLDNAKQQKLHLESLLKYQTLRGSYGGGETPGSAAICTENIYL